MFTEKIRAITRTIGGEPQIVGLDMTNQAPEKILRNSCNVNSLNTTEGIYHDIDGNVYKYESTDFTVDELEDFITNCPDENECITNHLVDFIRREREVSHEKYGIINAIEVREKVLDVELTDEERKDIVDNDDYFWEQVDSAIYRAIDKKIKQREKEI
jgi:hypothetical protein